MASLLLLRSMLYANALHKSKKKKQKKRKKSKSYTSISSFKITPGMCRICASENGDVPIFNNFVQPNIAEEIKHFSGITISKTDTMTQMCQNCLDLLNGCIMFRDMCQKNNKRLQELEELSVKEEYVKCESKDLNEDDQELDELPNEHNEDSNDSYNIPSPTFSDDAAIWGCNTCGKDFFDMDSYSDHLSRCPGDSVPKPPEELTKRKFLCDICGKTCSSNASLLVHMGIHENVFPFKCDVCPYQGRTMDLLKVHKRSHMADKPFKCTQCPKATTTSSNLAKHMRHVHSTQRPFKCTYCDKAFSYQHDMKRHIKDIHLRQGTVECDVCYKKFNTKKILQGHRWKIHKIKGERQGRLPSYLQHQMEEQDHHDQEIAMGHMEQPY
ncbi:zinc finger protein 676-like [Leguminivora glycinivorella]|uniref:zinc finger protein 676-like n=1 Tax=Leguminivora glycinivorella TaxID=1035111 RepID=UPI00200C7759|nr:zinc finger protein 676-like [Leguminivora glycinivorella]